MIRPCHASTTPAASTEPGIRLRRGLAILIVLGLSTFGVPSTEARELNKAAKEGDLAAVQALIEAGADAEAVGFGAFTPLHMAVREGHLEIARFLLDHGADPRATGVGNVTPLHMAALNQRPEAVKLLVDAGANVDALAGISQFDPNAGGIAAPPLAWAILKRWDWRFLSGLKGEEFVRKPALAERIETARALLDAGADPDAGSCDSRGFVLYLAADQGELPLVELLLEHGADVTVRNQLRSRPAEIARLKRHDEIAALLESLGDVGAEDTDLHRAARNGELDEVRRLIEEGADVDARNGLNRTPIYLAALNGHEEVVREILKEKPDLDVVSATIGCWTALHAALQEEHLAIARDLARAGADLSATISGGWTPLHFAAQFGNAETMKLLLQHGADPNAVSDPPSGESVLAVTIYWGEPEMADLLVEHGAVVDEGSRKLLAKRKYRKKFGHLLE